MSPELELGRLNIESQGDWRAAADQRARPCGGPLVCWAAAPADPRPAGLPPHHLTQALPRTSPPPLPTANQLLPSHTLRAPSTDIKNGPLEIQTGRRSIRRHVAPRRQARAGPRHSAGNHLPSRTCTALPLFGLPTTRADPFSTVYEHQRDCRRGEDHHRVPRGRSAVRFRACYLCASRAMAAMEAVPVSSIRSAGAAAMPDK